jgi:hypothetical protein
MNLVFMPLFFTSTNAFLIGSVVMIIEGCLTSPQLSNLYFTCDNVCNVLLIVYSMPYYTSVLSSPSLDATVSFPFGGGRGDVDDVRRNVSPSNFSLLLHK